jgi:16S rRNA (guanine527-N7)-methyltransferase
LLRRYDAPVGAADALEALIGLLARPEAPTAVHTRRDVVDRNIADSLAGHSVAELRSATLIADLGAGAGLPGLVLAAVLPEAEVVLVEAARRKSEFLRFAIAEMKLANADVVWSRAEEWEDGATRCDAVCARALAALPVLYEYAAPLLRQGGVLVAWKGAVPDEEAADAEAAAAHLGLELEAVRTAVAFPGSTQRTLHVVRKVAPTPARYPRRPGMATKRPLSARTLR